MSNSASQTVAPTQAEIAQLVALFNAGRYLDLERNARGLVERQPHSGIGWKALGIALKAQGKDALFALQNAAKYLTEDAEAQLNLGIALSDLGKNDEAVASYQRAVKLSPNLAEAHGNLGLALQSLGQLEAGVASYRRALEINPDNAMAHVTLGNALIELGQADAATASYRRALTIKPDYVEALNNLGSALKQLGQGDEAVACYRRALSIKPDYAEAHCNLGLALQDLGQLDAAVASYRWALETKPNLATAHANLGNALSELGQLEAAVASYRRALTLKPDNADALNNLGNALTALRQFDDAVASFRQALTFNPNFGEAHSNLGNALMSTTQLDDAIASFRRALEILPGSAEAHNYLGNAQKELGQVDAAAASYRRALAIKPDYVEAHSNLGHALKELGQIETAVASYRRALELDPGNESAVHMIAATTGSDAKRAPNGYIAQLFDGYAERFDTHLVEKLGYRIPEQIAALIRKAAASIDAEWDVLDLGCGTGLVGAALAPQAPRLVGVDLSQRMLKKARARNIYTRLEKRELVEMAVGEAPASYDVVTAADVFIYVGRLEALFAEVKRILRPGGLFGFSVEALDRLPGVQAADGTLRESWLLSSGRFAQSSAYVKRLALENGFETQHFGPTTVRFEVGAPILGWLVLLKRPGVAGA